MLTASHCSSESIYSHLHTHTNTHRGETYPIFTLSSHFSTTCYLTSLNSLFPLSFLPLLSIHILSACFLFIFHPTLIYRFPLIASCLLYRCFYVFPLSSSPISALHLFAQLIFFHQLPLLSLFRGEERHCLKSEEQSNVVTAWEMRRQTLYLKERSLEEEVRSGVNCCE